jgi:hypothetical protein
MDETLAPPRNFFISTADRIRAASGPPAYSRRKRHIEDLEDSLVAAAAEAFTGAIGAHRDRDASGAAVAALRILRVVEEDRVVAKELRDVNRLIEAHNLYYPIEANLRLDPVTRQQMDRGRPWQPLPPVTLDDILRRGALAAAAAARGSGGDKGEGPLAELFAALAESVADILRRSTAGAAGRPE